MQLSEAIRLGCTLSTQYFGHWGMDRPHARCAMGAAKEAVGLDLLCSYEDTLKAFPVLEVTFRSTCYSCPVCAASKTIFGMILHLNDIEEWPREQIANWVEEQERRLGYWPTEQKGDIDERGTSEDQADHPRVDSCSVHG